jgi:pimeloyl-ACP methyl ester carboxylesterase
MITHCSSFASSSARLAAKPGSGCGTCRALAAGSFDRLADDVAPLAPVRHAQRAAAHHDRRPAPPGGDGPAAARRIGARLHVLERGGHNADAEYPEAVAEALLAFLDP